MKNKYINALFLIFIVALPFSWANIGSMSIYRLVTIIVFLVWLMHRRFIIPIPVENDRRKLFFAWIYYVGYSILTIVLCPASVNVVFGMILLLMISFIFFSSSVDAILSKYMNLFHSFIRFRKILTSWRLGFKTDLSYTWNKN